MKKNKHIIKMVQPGSIAEELEIEPGDELISINDQKIEDVFDSHYLVNDDCLTVLIRKTNGEEWELEIEKDYEEDLGIEFDNGLMDEYRSCRNNCIFCFIDQMPPGMRETLYFKDDDSRLSFLQGNYVTLTNMSDHDIDRIIKYHLGPINISFQTTNPQLRCKMLHNRFAGDIFPKVQRLYEAGIEMNGQIVLCKGVNKYRYGLYPLEPFTKEDAQNVLECVHRWQKMLYAEYGLHFIHCSDEWYILAEQSMPPEEQYDGYLQLENGVGMLRLLDTEIQETVQGLEGNDTFRHFSVATGKLAAPYIEKNISYVQEKFPNIHGTVYAIRNDFFGPMITVSGLITGQDLIAQLKDQDLGERLLIPCNMLRAGENVFLDDITVEEAEEALQIKITVVNEDGASFVHAVVDDTILENHKRRQIYEQADCSNCGTT